MSGDRQRRRPGQALSRRISIGPPFRLARAPMRHSRLLKGPAPVLLLVVGAAVAGALPGGFKDLSVYLYGGRAVLDGLPVYEYGDPVTGLHFTYPPFAAVVMLPLALLSTWLAA